MSKDDNLFDELLELKMKYSDVIVLHEQLKAEYNESITKINEIRFELVYEDQHIKNKHINNEEHKSNFIEEKITSAEMDLKKIEDRIAEIENYYSKNNNS